MVRGFAGAQPCQSIDLGLAARPREQINATGRTPPMRSACARVMLAGRGWLCGRASPVRTWHRPDTDLAPTWHRPVPTPRALGRACRADAQRGRGSPPARCRIVLYGQIDNRSAFLCRPRRARHQSGIRLTRNRPTRRPLRPRAPHHRATDGVYFVGPPSRPAAQLRWSGAAPCDGELACGLRYAVASASARPARPPSPRGLSRTVYILEDAARQAPGAVPERPASSAAMSRATRGAVVAARRETRRPPWTGSRRNPAAFVPPRRVDQACCTDGVRRSRITARRPTMVRPGSGQATGAESCRLGRRRCADSVRGIRSRRTAGLEAARRVRDAAAEPGLPDRAAVASGGAAADPFSPTGRRIRARRRGTPARSGMSFAAASRCVSFSLHRSSSLSIF